MFKQARIKLTAWYLLIIMGVSLSFSALIYRMVGGEFQRRLDVIEQRLELRRYGLRPPPGETQFFLHDIDEARERVFWILVDTNAAIFIFSAIAGYFLAGKTLAPIEHALEEQKRFVADASHELKTPLTALRTSIEVALRDKELTADDARSVLTESLEDVAGLHRLSNDLLSMAHYQQSHNSVKKEPVDLKEIINTARRDIAPLAKKKSIVVSVKARAQTVMADEMSLKKVMTILLDNAVKYTQPGGNVSVVMTGDRRNVRIDVRDTGIGISKEDIPHIFDRFYRADQSRSKQSVSGFGLGLSMAKKIMDLYGGSIAVTSTPGKGSTFTVRLPLPHS